MSEAPKVTPALTPEEWAATGVRRADWVASVGGDLQNGIPLNAMFVGNQRVGAPMVPPEKRHALAALALHGQPFGFTRKDVTMLREEAECEWPKDSDEYRWLYGLASRIEALLPPEGT